MNEEELGKLSVKCRNIAIGLHTKYCGSVPIETQTFDHITIEEDGNVCAIFSKYMYGENEERTVHISEKELNMDTTEIDKLINEKLEKEKVIREAKRIKDDKDEENHRIYMLEKQSKDEYDTYLKLKEKFKSLETIN